MGVVSAEYQCKMPQGYLRFFILFFVIFLLSIHSGLRGNINDLDAAAYFGWYEELQRLDFHQFLERFRYWGLFYDDGLNKFEAGFAMMGFMAINLGCSAAQFIFACATLSVIPKIFCFFRYFKNPLVFVCCILWYVCWQYLLMEMNAVRAGLALAVVVIGFKYFIHGNGKALYFIIIASLFHISAVCLSVLVILNKYPISRKSTFFYTLILSVLIGYFPVHFLINFFFGGFEKIAIYYTGATEGELFSEINRFNMLTLLRVVIFFVLLYLHRPISENPVSRFGFYGLWISLCFYFAFSSLPVLAGRLAELFGFFSVFSIGGFVKRVRPSVVSGAFVLMVCCLQFYAIVFYSKLVNFFYFVDVSWLAVDLVSFVPL